MRENGQEEDRGAIGLVHSIPMRCDAMHSKRKPFRFEPEGFVPGRTQNETKLPNKPNQIQPRRRPQNPLRRRRGLCLLRLLPVFLLAGLLFPGRSSRSFPLVVVSLLPWFLWRRNRRQSNGKDNPRRQKATPRNTTQRCCCTGTSDRATNTERTVCLSVCERNR